MKNSKVLLMRDTGCIADIDSEMKTLLEAKKCTIDYFSPATAHHMLTLELGKKKWDTRINTPQFIK